MMTGGTPISGNPHIFFAISCAKVTHNADEEGSTATFVAFLGDQDQKEAARLWVTRGTLQGFDAFPDNEDATNKLWGGHMM